MRVFAVNLLGAERRFGFDESDIWSCRGVSGGFGNESVIEERCDDDGDIFGGSELSEVDAPTDMEAGGQAVPISETNGSEVSGRFRLDDQSFGDSEFNEAHHEKR